LGIIAKAHTREGEEKKKRGKGGKKGGPDVLSPLTSKGSKGQENYNLKKKDWKKRGGGEEKERGRERGKEGGEKRGGEGGNSPIFQKNFRGQAPVPPFSDLLGGHPPDPPG